METHAFRDFDAFADSVRDVDSVMMLQNPVHRRWVISQLDLPEIHLQLGRLGSGNLVEGQSWPHGYVLYLPFTEACQATANGATLRPGSLMILEPGCEFCLNTKFEHDWCSIFVPTHKFEQWGDRAQPASGSRGAVCRLTQPNQALAHRFGTIVQQIMAAGADCPAFESAPAATAAATELLRIAASVVGERRANEPKREGRPRLSRQEIIRRSKALLEARDGEPVLVAELAAAADVSERTLETAFNEYFGVGPARYLRLRRLHQVYRALRAADAEAVSVSEVLVRHGEWQFGRFASRYRRVFGERPSETLRAKKR